MHVAVEKKMAHRRSHSLFRSKLSIAFQRRFATPARKLEKFPRIPLGFPYGFWDARVSISEIFIYRRRLPRNLYATHRPNITSRMNFSHALARMRKPAIGCTRARLKEERDRNVRSEFNYLLRKINRSLTKHSSDY